MILRDLLVRTGMRASQSMERLNKILRLKRSGARQLELVSMEDRLLFSAAPGPMPVAPAPDAQMVMAASLDAPVEIFADASAQPDSATMMEAQGLQPLGVLSDTSSGVLEAPSRELVFIDTGAENYQRLLDDLWSNHDPNRQVDVVLLSASEDGLTQITETLTQYQTEKLDAVHFVTHGADRAIKLGNTWLDAASLDANRDCIASWGQALKPGADLLIYGCDLAGNDLGRALLNNLVDLTGADIAASIDDTGSTLLGGNWDLEYELGEVETEVAFSALAQEEYDGLLAAFSVSNTNDSGVGSLRQAIINANGLAGTDSITFAALGAGTHTINLTSTLTVSSNILIDGISATGYAGTPLIQINAAGIGTGSNALQLDGASDNSIIQGFAIYGTLNGNGIQMNDASGVVIRSNYIGLRANGTSAGNSTGIVIGNSSNITIGGTTAADRNVISGNLDGGIRLESGTSGVQIQGNYIGTNIAGTAALGNGSDGVSIIGSSGNTVGGTVVGARNIISGNSTNGVRIDGVGASSNSVIGNYIGTDVTGLLDRGNGEDGIQIQNGASNNIIGGLTATERNVVSGNDNAGIAIDGAATSGNTILGNYIGLGSDGSTDIGNSHDGVHLQAAANTIIGSTLAGGGNVISGNEINGIGGDAASGTVIQNNIIGLNALGTADRGNTSDGVRFVNASTNNTIGTVGAGRNVISGNDVYGVNLIGTGTNSNTIANNYIGLNAAGTALIGNSNDGVILLNGASSNTIGGSTTASRNVISGNSDGVQIGGVSGGSNSNTIQNNYIGTDVTGTLDLGNNDDGIDIDNAALSNQVLDNLISGNTSDGIDLGDAGASTGTIIRSNRIGTAANGTTTLGNSGHGILIGNGGTANNTAIGGTTAGQGNTIAYNSGDGIYIPTSTGVSILGNSIFSNTGLGIDLGTDGVTANDSGDGDTGANNLLNTPIIYAATIVGGNVTITGEARSGASIEFYQAAADFTGYGEGRTFIGRNTVSGSTAGTVDATARQFSFTFAVGTLVEGQKITSTATDSSNNTSEFSRNVVAVQPAGISVIPTITSTGSETRINTTTANLQAGPDVNGRNLDFDAAGNYVVVWESDLQDGNGFGIYAQRYNAAGLAQGGEILVNQTTSGVQDYGVVSVSNDGSFMVVWHSDQSTSNDIYVRSYAANGTPLTGEFRVNTTTSGNQRFPSISNDGIGNYVIVWEDRSSGNNDIRGQRINSAGTSIGSEFVINTTTSGDQTLGAVSMNSSGDFVVTWTSSTGDGNGSGVFGQRFDNAAVALGSQLQINQTTSGNQEYTEVAIDSFGGFVVVWESSATGGGDVFFRRYDGSGTAVTGETLAHASNSNKQSLATVDVDSRGNFIVAWTSNSQDGSGDGVYARRFSAGGVALASEFLVNATTSGSQSFANVAFAANDDFIIAWEGAGTGDADGVFYRRYSTQLTSTEAGGATGFQVVLDTAPTANVSVAASSSDTTEGVVSPTTLTFTSGSWNSPQSVTVTGVDDVIFDGTIAYSAVLAAATSSDAGYSGFNPADLTLNNTDNDIASYSISGTIYEDVDGDGLVSDDGIGLANAIVSIYRDDGDGVLDAGDGIVNSLMANGSGQYTFSGLTTDTYWVVADSRSFIGTGGLNGGYTIHDQWAEQTYGTAGSVGWNGSAYTFTGTAGAFFGGMRQDRGDNGASLLTGEHVTRVAVSAANVTGVDTGFSYNVVTNTRDGDEVGANNRTVQGSLRQFIQNSNALAGTQSTNFQITDPLVSGAHTINLTSALPTLSQAAVIDARTEEDYASTPVVVLSGGGTIQDGLRLYIGSDGTTVRGLAIVNFTGDGIDVSQTNNHTIASNFIGVNATGNVVAGNQVGINLYLSTGTTIGGTAAGDGNVISGNTSLGINVAYGSGNTISGNTIGLNASGTAALANVDFGVLITLSTGNHIGGTTANERNVISGNGTGVLLNNGDNNTILGNYIGTDVTGLLDRGNSANGVHLINGSSGNTIGGTVVGARNVISGNNQTGVYITDAGSSSNVIAGNTIGLGSDGSTDLGNTGQGVSMASGATLNTVGGATSASRNVISGNDGFGVYMGSGTSGTTVLSNYIGTNAAGTSARSNIDGIYIDASANNVIGQSGAGNLISGNTYYGVIVDNAGADANSIQANTIGTNAAGTTALANDADGILIRLGATNTLVGSSGAGQGNLISGNAGHGIAIQDAATTGTIVRNNLIGTDATGLLDVGNIGNGITVTAANTTIGGNGVGEGNLISGNNLRGVYVTGASSTNVQIVGNGIGTTITGMQGLGNTFDGVEVNFGAGGVTIRDNLLAANGQWGINLSGTGAGNTVQGNTVGLNVTQTAILGGAGIGASSDGHTITGNTIGGSSSYGIYLTGSANNTIQGNYIGTNSSGAIGLGNSLQGIGIDGANSDFNLIGGTDTGEGNVIANNTQDGISIASGSGIGISILGNTFRNNGGLAIDINDNGVTGNDPNDTDAGANGLQNFPVISSATLSGSNLTLSGTLDTDGLSTQYRIEFYGNPSGTADTTNGEGRVYLGTTTVTTDGSGDATFSGVVLTGVSLGVGDSITATATRIDTVSQVGISDFLAYGSTSEFAANVTATVAVNTAPAFTGLDETPTFVEGGSPVVLDGNATVLDSELNAQGDFSGATLTLARNGGANPEEQLAFTGVVTTSGADVLVSGVVVGTYTFTGGQMQVTFDANATPARVNTLLQNITYSNSSNTPPASVQINWTFNDQNTGTQGTGGALSTTSSTTVTITATNDAPVNSALGSRAMLQGQTVTFSSTNGTAISVSDPDVGGASLRVTLTVGQGTLTLSGTTGLMFTAGDGTADATLTFTGTAANINAALNGLTYTPNAGFIGNDSLQIVTNDLGNSGSGGALSDTDSVMLNVQATSNVGLWLGTDKEGIDINGVSWGDSEIVSFGNPNLAFEPGTTSGTFSSIVNLEGFAADGNTNVSALHYVSRTTVVGSGANSITLLKGDILFSVESNETFGGVSVTDKDLIRFRPNVANDYSSGTFQIVINSPTGDKIREVSLVEATLTVGGITLNPGDLLLVQSSATYDKDVWRFVATSAGNGTTVGTLTEFMDGADIDNGAQIGGLALIQTTTQLGDITLTAGQLLLSIRSDQNSIGTNLIAVSKYDMLVLDVTQAGTNTVANATLVFQGADVGLSSGGEEIFGLTMVATNYAPVLNGANNLTPISEDPLTNSGTLVSTLISGQMTDADQGALSGIAVTSADNSNGTWQYSLNSGGLWNSFGTPSESASRLLAADATTLVRFVPNANWNGSTSITFRAWDRTTGTGGLTADVISNGGSTSFSTATANSSQTVTAVNDAPSITLASVGGPYVENGTPALFDTAPTIIDPDSSNFDTGTLTASIESAGTVDDRITIRNQGNGVGQIGLSGTDVSYQNVVIGTWSGGTSGSTPLVVTLNSQATLAAVQALAGNVQFSNVSDNPSTTSRLIRIVVTDGDGGTSNNGQNLLTVTDVNDTPSVTVSGGITINEEASGTMTVSVDDVDLNGGELSVQLTLANNKGTFTLATVSGLTFTVGSGTNNNAMTFTGTQAAVNAALATITYTGSLNATGADTLLYSFSDQGATGSGGAQVHNGGLGITIQPVNDAPTITNAVTLVMPGTDEDTLSSPATVSSLLNTVDLAYNDVDSGAVRGIAITAATGGGNWQYSTDGSTWVDVVGVSTTNALLVDSSTQLRFNPDSQNGSSASIVFRAWDQTSGTASTNGTPAFANPAGGGTTTAFSSSTANLLLSVSSVNDAPQFVAASPLNGILEDEVNNTGTLISQLVSSAIMDVDAGAVKGIAIIDLPLTNGTWEYTLNGTTWISAGTPSTVAALLLPADATTAIRFVPNADVASGSGLMMYRAWDQTTGTSGGTADVTTSGSTTAFSSGTNGAGVGITPVNDAPVFSAGTVANLTVVEDSGFTSLGLSSVAYGPGGGVDEASQTLTYAVTSIPGSSIGDIYLADGTTKVVVGSYSLSEIQGMQFKPADNATGANGFQFNVYDNGGVAFGGSDTISQLILITVNAANDAPTVTMTSSALAYTENGVATAIDPALTVIDVDSANLTGATVTISGNYANGEDVLAFTDQLGITGSWSASTGVLTLSGTTTRANYQTALRSVTYFNNSESPSVLTRTISVVASDASLPSVAATRDITVSAVNDAPAITTNTLTISEGATVVLSGTQINATDPDNTAAQLTYSVSGLSGGQFELVATPGTAITSFTQAQINSGAVQFVHYGGETAPAYSLTVSDGGLSAGPQAVTASFTNINDAPTIATNSLTISEGGTVVLSNAYINSTDPDNTAAQLSYTATGITGGQFELVAAPGTAITGFTQAQINSGEVQFVHNGGESAPSYTLTVNDGAVASAPSLVTIGTFTNVNDAPVMMTNTLAISEGGTVVLTNAEIQATDADNTPAQLTYSASSISHGQFELVASPGVAITSFTQDQINAGAVQFVHNGGEVAPAYTLTVNDGSLSSSPVAMTLSAFTNVNDAPVISAPASVTITASQASPFTGPNTIQVSDSDATSLQVTIAVSDGGFTLSQTTGLTFTIGDGQFDSSMQFSGSISDINAALDNAKYQYSLSHGATESLTIDASDLGQSGMGGVQTASSLTTLAIAVPTAVLGDAFLQGSYLEVGLGQNGAIGSDGVAPVGFTSAGGLLGVVVDNERDGWSTYDGDFVTPGSPEEAWGVHVGGTTYSNSNTVPSEITGNLVNYQSSPSGQIVEWQGNQSGLQVVQTYSVGANQLYMDVNVALTNLSGVDLAEVYYYRNVDPDNNVNQGSINGFKTNNTIVSQGDVTGASLVTATQSDGSYLGLMGLGANSRVTHGGFSNRNPVDIYNGTGGLSQTGSSYSDEAVSLAFHYASIANGETVTARFRYYFASTDAAIPVVDLDANDSGTRTGGDFQASFMEDGGPVAIVDTDALVFVPSESNLSGMTLSISNLRDGVAETLAVNTTGTSIAAAYDSATGVLTLSGSASDTDYRNVLRTLTYNNSSQNPDATTRQIQVSATSAAGTSETVTSYVTVIATNDMPVISANQLTISEGGVVVLSSANMNSGDPDSSTTQLRWTVTGLSGGRFEFLAAPGVAITSFSQADINAGIVQFVHDGGDAAPAFQLAVTDGTLSSGSQAAVITFIAVNDAPTISAISNQTINEDTALGPLAFTVGDSETAAASLTVTATSSNVGLIPLANIVLGGNGINRTVTITPALNQNGGPVTITLSVSDGTISTLMTFQVVVDAINDAPTISGVANQTINEDSSTGPLSITVGDIDSNVNGLTLTATSSDQSLIPDGNFVVAGSGANRTVTITPTADFNGGPVTITLTVSDGVLSTQTTFQVVVNAVNDAPTISVVPDQTMDEDSTSAPLAVTVGDIDSSVNGLTVTATSSDQALLPDGNLVISGTGTNRSVAITPSPNWNGGPVTITLTVSDGSTTTQSTFTVNVTPVNDLPVIHPQGFVVNENSVASTVVGTVVASDIDAGAVLTYAIDSGNTNGAFAIDSATGQITVLNPTALDFETTPQYQLTVSVTDSVGTPQTATITIDLNDINEVPTTLSLSNAIANENSAVGSPVGSLSSTDVDTADSATYSLVDDAGGLFTVDPNTGEITVNGALDFETSANLTIIARVTDGGGLVLDRSFVISLVDINEAPVLVGGAFGLSENSSNGTLVGTLTASDVDAGDQLTFSLISGNTGGAFSMDAITGAITVANTTALDFESNGAFTLTVQVADRAGLTHQQLVTVTLSDVNEQPMVLAGTYHINEWSSIGSLVGLVAASDVDAGDSLAYSFVAGNTGGRFTIDPSTGHITVANSSNFTHESQSSYTITVQVQDAAGLTHSADMRVIVDNVNEPPVVVNDQYTVDQLQSLATTTIDGVLVNDSDSDSAFLTVSLVQGPQHGTLAFNADGTFTYVSDDLFYGLDSFRYIVTDGLESSSVATVSLTVNLVAPGGGGPDSETVDDEDDVEVADEEDETDHDDSEEEPGDTGDTSSESEGTSTADIAVSVGTASPTGDVLPSAVNILDQFFHRQGSHFDQRSGSRQSTSPRSSLVNGVRRLPDALPAIQQFIPAPLQDLTFAILKNHSMWNELNSIRHQMETGQQSSVFAENIVVGTTTAVTGGLTVGYVIWLIRGGSLLATMVSVIPTWASFDPLPVMDRFEEEESEEDKESLASIVSGA